MANIWDTLKNVLGNAGTAAQNVNQQAINTAQNKAPATKTQTTSQAVTSAPATTGNTTVKGYYETQAQSLGTPYATGTTPTVNQIVQNTQSAPATTEVKNKDNTVNVNGSSQKQTGSGGQIQDNAVYLFVRKEV